MSVKAVAKLKQTGRPGGVTKIRSSGNFMMLAEVPKPPKSFNQGQAQVWADICEVMVRRGQLSEGDLMIVENLSVCVAENRQIQKVLSEEGLLVTNVQGNRTQHPLIYIRKGNEQQINLITSALGLSPRARLQLQTQGRFDNDDGNTLPEVGAF